jgi:hypothetical protein
MVTVTRIPGKKINTKGLVWVGLGWILIHTNIRLRMKNETFGLDINT